MPARSPTDGLGPRERQLLEALFRLGRATATEIQRALPDAPSNSSVRTMLALLETKGHVRHALEGRRFVYEATLPRDRASRSALRHVMETFFEGSIDAVVTALVRHERRRLSKRDLDRLKSLIERAGETDV